MLQTIHQFHNSYAYAVSVNTQGYNLPKSCNHPDHYPTALQGGHSSTIVCLAQNFAETKSSSVSLIVHYRYPSTIYTLLKWVSSFYWLSGGRLVYYLTGIKMTQ